MSPQHATRIPEILKTHESDLLNAWVSEQTALLAAQRGRISETDLREQSREFLGLFRQAAQTGDLETIQGPAWRNVLEMLTGVSQSRARQGFTPVQTASFVLSLNGIWGRPLSWPKAGVHDE